jgi:hypothetical protein
MKPFELLSSKDTLVINGKVQEIILSKIIKEAYESKGIYAECKILVTQKNGDDNLKNNLVAVVYKELWDCYRNLTGKEDYHPYDKKHPFSLGKAFILKNIFEKQDNFLNLNVEDFIKFEKLEEKKGITEIYQEELKDS